MYVSPVFARSFDSFSFKLSSPSGDAQALISKLLIFQFNLIKCKSESIFDLLFVFKSRFKSKFDLL